MESNTSYPPTIDEFYVGFDCAVDLTLSTAGLGTKDDWFKFAFGDKSNVDKLVKGTFIVKGNINEFNIRIKYLDKEDIESLGWVLKNKSVDLWFEKGSCLREDGYHLANRKLQYGIHDHRLKLSARFNGGDKDEIIFQGYCRNKSELIKILKQCDFINYDEKGIDNQHIISDII